MLCNVCDKCDAKPHVFSFDVADTGRCSKCGKIGECWDHDLIKFYKSFLLTDEQIHKHLPRLINSNIDEHQQSALLLDIGLQINKIIANKTEKPI
jgi:hypothetical protein